MKKLTAALLAAVLSLCFLAGCSRKAPAETTAPTEPPVVEIPHETEADERPYLNVELNFQSTLAENDPRARVMRQAAEYFEKKTGAAIHFTWLAGEIAGEADIFQTSVEILSGLDCVADLTELAAAANYEDLSFESLRQRVIGSCGSLKGIPFTPSLIGLYFNRDVLDSCGIMELPTNWEEFLNVCQKLKAAGFQMALNSEDGAQIIQMHLEGTLGAENLTRLLAEDQLSENEQAALALQQLIDFVDGGYAVHDTYPAGQNKMGLAGGAMIVGTDAMCREIENGTLTDINWGVTGWSVGAIAYGDCDVLAIHSGCENTQAAFDFLMLLTTGEFDQLRADVTGGIPADPNNESSISGAAELLLTARHMGEISDGYRNLALQLWDGKYKTGAIFASAMEQLG